MKIDEFFDLGLIVHFESVISTDFSKCFTMLHLVHELLLQAQFLTLSSPVLSDSYTSKCSGPYWPNPLFLFFLIFKHSGAPERQSAQMSEIKNVG